MTISTFVRRLVLATAILAFPLMGYAQEAALTGTISDTTGGVLPGVTVTAVHDATGNTFTAVTDSAGRYRIPVRVGAYRVSAELQGFANVVRTGVQLLVGQVLNVDLQMSPATLQETVTVTGEAPLIDTARSTIGSNIDPQQMRELPLNGRNWMDLARLAPGVRSVESSGVPDTRQGYSQINVDGQQITQLIAATDAEQPKYSQDSIAEFVISSNRFSASEGRSAGFLVTAVTKSGTNMNAGTFSGYFRSDKLNAADPIEKRVLPYQNQQLGGTFGGPIIRDRLHYFGNFEYEREPNTITYNSPYPFFNIDQPNVRWERKALGRVDFQFSPQTRANARVQDYYQVYYTGGGATNHPSSTQRNDRYSSQAWGNLTHVLGTQTVFETKGGFASATHGNERSALRWGGGCYPNAPRITPDRCNGSPTITLTGYSVGNQTGQLLTQDTWQIRSDLSTAFARGGRHDVKVGGEYFYNRVTMRWCTSCLGAIDARGGPVPANIQEIFPVWNDASTWNLAALSPITRRVNHGVSSTNFIYYPTTQMASGWIQDDWKPADRLTLNLGVRWDFTAGAFSEKIEFRPWLPGDLAYDWNNFSPRTGFAYTLNERTVVRGGYGLFYTQMTTDEAHQSLSNTVTVGTEVNNDRRPDFAANWFNGPVPTFDQAIARSCDINNVAGCIFRRTASGEINLGLWDGSEIRPANTNPYAHQASIGMQRQIGSVMAFEADYVFTGGRNEERSHNINLSYNPATGANYPFSDIARRPFPQWGDIAGAVFEGRSNYQALQTSFTKRMSNRWQASGTYSYAVFKEGHPLPQQYALDASRLTRSAIPFTLAPDFGGEYYDAGQPRHLGGLNGIWSAGRGIQLSGIYTYRSTRRYNTSFGGDRRDAVGLLGGGVGRLRADGTVTPRFALEGDPYHRIDVRLQKRFSLGGRRSLDGMLEAFNLFNNVNYGSYTTQESNASFGRPSFNNNIAYAPRMLQLGFRLAF